jgi:hypothetical protein
MISKPILLGLLVAGCLTAAAGGAYVAVRQAPNLEQTTASKPAASPSTGIPADRGAVAETEAVVTPAATPSPAPAGKAAPSTPAAATDTTIGASATKKPTPRVERNSSPTIAKTETSPSTPTRTPRPATPVATPAPATSTSTAAQQESSLPVERPAPARETASSTHSTPPAAPPLPEPVVPEAPPAPVRPQLVEVVVPSSSVVGLQVERSISSETARVEDRVEGRVTRDVIADGRVAIAAGTRVIGDVTLVERGGKMKDKARLGVRFHTLVLADGSQVPFRTDSIYREGASPGSESARKIGGAAMGGAILGAIIGGAKGAAIGGATGAGAGSAVVMAGDRNAATLPAGTVVTVRLSSPLSIDVEKEL